MFSSLVKAIRCVAMRCTNKQSRSLSTSSSHAKAAPELFEVREYVLKPEGMKTFLTLTHQHAALRSKLLPFLGMFTCDTGGILNRVVHFYNYPDFATRDTTRKAAANNAEWVQTYLAQSRLTVAQQTSVVYQPALPVLEAAQAVQPGAYRSPPPGDPSSPPVVYELRQYELAPGWNPVPKMVDAFAKGLPAKIAADPAAAGQLVFFGYTDVGVINSVMELWRYPSAQDSIKARQAARGVPEWRAAVTEVAAMTQRFSTCYLHPTAFSPWQ